ncbi:hypothetical protein ACFQ3N_13945 [Virgibacillus byunsanensis]|uniref:Uncharacterized protein n=1 Tax=Virgibacillus byunsanensis TaxID=570945 RepID=A0ABW3LPB1_9BACI
MNEQLAQDRITFTFVTSDQSEESKTVGSFRLNRNKEGDWKVPFMPMQ